MFVGFNPVIVILFDAKSFVNYENTAFSPNIYILLFSLSLSSNSSKHNVNEFQRAPQKYTLNQVSSVLSENHAMLFF